MDAALERLREVEQSTLEESAKILEDVLGSLDRVLGDAQQG